MKRILLAVLIAALSCPQVFGWGREGHETIAAIAEKNLKPSTKKIVEKYLDNHSIIYYAKWMDEVRRTPEYRESGEWHGVPVDENLYHMPDKNGKGDAVTAINAAVALLKDYKNLPDSTVSVNIKYLIHLVGDMHCPAHIYYKGRNQVFNVVFGDKYYIKPIQTIKFHSLWDYGVVQSSRIWSPVDYAEQLDRLSKKEIKAITAGTPEEWLHESAVRCEVQFDWAGPGDTVAQDFVNKALPLIEKQWQYAGYRLAHVLNSLF